jgi:hypothetical protein
MDQHQATLFAPDPMGGPHGVIDVGAGIIAAEVILLAPGEDVDVLVPQVDMRRDGRAGTIAQQRRLIGAWRAFEQRHHLHAGPERLPGCARLRAGVDMDRDPIPRETPSLRGRVGTGTPAAQEPDRAQSMREQQRAAIAPNAVAGTRGVEQVGARMILPRRVPHRAFQHVGVLVPGVEVLRDLGPGRIAHHADAVAVAGLVQLPDADARPGREPIPLPPDPREIQVDPDAGYLRVPCLPGHGFDPHPLSLPAHGGRHAAPPVLRRVPDRLRGSTA